MTALKIKKLNKGFTLIELLVVIGILAILLAITLIAINPARQFQQARNTQRSSDVNSILNAVSQYIVDQGNSIDTIIPAACTSAAPCNVSQSGVTDAFCTELAPKYIAALPSDPQTNGGSAVLPASCAPATAWNTGYTIYRGANSRITVSAPKTEPFTAATTDDITVTR
ncbi:MAG TPA: type II secretion system protein [Candidatus Saccharimonadales bacterium]|nr:type II secretion system protein [Candidatus Saccharimonadales bacterium]